MIRYIQTLKEPLTEGLAAEVATMPPHRGERPLMNNHVLFLIEKIKAGLFYPPRWAVAWFNGKKYRVNGQHSSTALASCNGDFPRGLHVFIDEFAVETDLDMAELFAQFDPKRGARTDEQVVMATVRQHDELAKLKPTHIRTALDGLVFWHKMCGKITGKVDAIGRRGLVGDNIEYIIWQSDLFSIGRMRVAGIMGAVAATYHVCSTAGKEFWKLVIDESHPDCANATRTLGKFLVKLEAGGEFDRKRGKPWTSRAVYVKACHAWNAWRRGKTTDLAYFEDAGIPHLV